MTNACGVGTLAVQRALQSGTSGLRRNDFAPAASLATWIGRVDAVDASRMPDAFAAYDCRNNRLAQLALEQDGFLAEVRAAALRHGADRIGVSLGTTTSGILSTELAYRALVHGEEGGGDALSPEHYRCRHSLFATTEFVRAYLSLRGTAATISTACSSSAKVFGTAARLIAARLIDAAVVGGVDSMCLTTLYGFNSLELLAADICRPWDAGRNGLSIGEAAAFALVERESAVPQGWLLGVGESNDGYHMSTPHPEGAGAIAAMRGALADAAMQPGDIDYINLHGTATPSNDASEDRAVGQVFGPATPCSSTKGATGHTLGAAGGVEAVIALLAMRHGLMPAGLNVQQRDSELHLDYLLENRHACVRRVVSNSFGFGGSNASLVFGGVV